MVTARVEPVNNRYLCKNMRFVREDVVDLLFYGPVYGNLCPTPAGWLLEKCVHDFQLTPFRKIGEAVSAIACAKPKRTFAGLWWFTRANFGVEVAYNDVKMGFAINDVVIHVVINYIYFFISMASCWKISLNYIQVIFAIDLKGELGQPIRYAFEAGDISCNFLVYYETESPMAGAAADEYILWPLLQITAELPT